MSRLASPTQNCACLAVSLVLCGLFVLSVPATVQAQDDRERGSVSFGAFITDRRTSTRLDSAQGPGTDIDLETDLGLEPSLTVARLGGYFWLTPRQRFDFSIFDLSRTAPLPVIGLRGEYEITDRITLRGAGEWFRIDTGDVSGRLSDLYVGADYGFSERMAVDLAYNDVSMSIGASESGGFEGTLDWSYDGFLLYFKYDFLGDR